MVSLKCASFNWEFRSILAFLIIHLFGRVPWLLLINLVVNINAKNGEFITEFVMSVNKNLIYILTWYCGPVYSFGAWYGIERGTLFEAESEPLPQDISCRGAQGPCLEKASTGGSNDPSFQAASYSATSSGVGSQRSRRDFMQVGDTLPLKLDQNWQPVQTSKNAEHDPSTPRIVKYGPVYRFLKPHSAHTSRIMPSPSYKPPVSSVVTTSQFVPNGYKDGFSQGNVYNTVVATYASRNKPLLSNMVITSSPMITFIMPNQSDYQLAQTINKTQSSHEPGTPIEPLVTADKPAAETSKPFEHGQEIHYLRPPSQPQVPNESRFQSPHSVRKLIYAPKPQLARKNLPALQSKSTEPGITQLGNAYSSADKASNVFKAARTTYIQQTSKPVQGSRQLADFSKSDLYDSGSTAIPSSGSVYRFTRPGYIHGTSGSSSMHVPSSSAKTEHSNFIQRFYKPGLSFPKVGYGSPSSAVASSETRYDFTQSGKVSSSACDACTLHSQPTSSTSNLFQIPYYLARQGRSSMFQPLQPDYKSLPTRYMQVPSKGLNTQFSAIQDSELLNDMRNQASDVQPATSEGFQTWHNYDSVLVSDHVQNDDQGALLQKTIQSRPRKPKNLSDYLSRLPLPAEQSVANNYNQPYTGQSNGQTESVNHNPIPTINSTSKAIQGFYNTVPLLGSQGNGGFATIRPVSSGYVVDQTTNHLGVLVEPFQQSTRPSSSSLSSQHVSSENWYGPSQADLVFALRGSRPVVNFQKVQFSRPLQSGSGSFSNTQKKVF